jgi:hypothetical protein
MIKIAAAVRSRKRAGPWRPTPESLEARRLLTAVPAVIQPLAAASGHGAEGRQAAAGVTRLVQASAAPTLLSFDDRLNDATIVLRWHVVDVLPRWRQNAPSVLGVTGSSAILVHEHAEQITRLLESKLILTDALSQDPSDQKNWDIRNELSGLFSKVKNQTSETLRLQSIAFARVREFDQKVTALQEESKALEGVMQGVASRGLKKPLPQNIADLVRTIENYNEAGKKKFWDLLDGSGSWNNDRWRIDILNQLGALHNDPAVPVLESLFLGPQVEAINREASVFARDVQLRSGTWQLIGNDLTSVDHFLSPDNRISWSLSNVSTKTQLRFVKDVAARSARYVVTGEPLEPKRA